MTYLQFHLVFTLPPILLLLLVTWRDLRAGLPLAGGLGRANRFALGVVGIHLALALVYTTPWDNYLVYREVWGYPPGRVLFAIGYVPVEEYLFFVLQTILTSLLLFTLARQVGPGPAQLEPGARAPVRVAGSLVALVVAAVGVVSLSFPAGTYLGLILVWGMPVLALQWAFGGDFLAARWRLVVPALVLPTLYLWVADRIAIGLDIWWISPELTTGLKPLGLPLEEAVFFLMTNLFVVFGTTLALHPASQARLDFLRGYMRQVRWWHAAFVLWALSMIPTPLVPGAFAPLAYSSTFFLALGVFGYALETYGRVAVKLFVVAFGFGLAVEWIGKTTGLPFGAYDYAPSPLSLFGVPLLVPLGWWAFSFIALAVTPQRGKLGLAPAALVAWDLGLDPLMVSQGFWTFDRGAYFGVPLSNFLGWYAAGLALVALLVRLEPRLRTLQSAELRLVFTVQAFLISLGLVFFGLALAGLVTFVAMGGFALIGWRSPQGKLLPTK